MREPQQIDYAAVFQALPGMVALLTPDLVYVDANDDFVQLAGRPREQLLGRYIFDVFPENPNDPAAAGMRETRESMLRVVATGERDTMAVLRYDIQDAERPGHWREHFWSPVNAPVLSPDGQVALVLHRVEEVTELLHATGVRADSGRARVLEAELYTRARELQDVNERLRKAHAHEREVALALQTAMMPAPRHTGQHPAAVRYRPAVGGLNVCGDWYDLVDLPVGRMAVAVGDVVGNGLAAACAMGQLRSALSAATRVAEGPAQALEVLDMYASSVDGAESTTVATTFIDWNSRTITYSCAGHPPPAMLRSDGTVVFLDQATDPPIDARPEHVERPQARAPFAEGDTLVLYTDGLIERRGEDIDTGLGRLADCLARHGRAASEPLADALLADLLPATGNTDDTALVVVGL
ncbi:MULTISPECIES: PP2C family protein-serine/threonine phosphatase [unclassified Streptomyces]|uniref:PP2C family protein-serine/threonine phosphatase n=1 Tax=unclassified Streptomyces TaxID=2593676 RepID=UPI00225B4AA0|nr:MULTISPECIES: SpoIIE family protein phosphatase [unclassified Streptomyces]MCX5053615.1 SpoIIE family protein phosphatase [Streptomyces sp. NBC_00474]MCX5058883.1 SpoIIE family protein phosphatase [Streptomyces sp. NBC_00452]MCX5244236.1 SpoIIE family protein phosphatase [Streptomyces sp. NBC_00201]MCX5290031.1 SpoIIE family protein phosphatase [Streptomyces sp. NBC_00183]